MLGKEAAGGVWGGVNPRKRQWLNRENVVVLPRLMFRMFEKKMR